MSGAQTSSTVLISASKTSATSVRAVQDRDCVDRAKFRYDLDFVLPDIFFDQFPDAKITIREFSKLVPYGKDLFSIVRSGIFRADGIVRANKMTVSFDGDPRNWPLDVMRDFDRRLAAVGYGAVDYSAGAPPNCAECPARFEKKCAGLYPDET